MVESYLEEQQCFVAATIDKAANNLAFICKKYYIPMLLGDVDLPKSKSKTYSKTTHSTEEIVQGNIEYCKKFDL